MKKSILSILILLTSQMMVIGQKPDTAIINAIIEEATRHSQLRSLGHELIDVIGPRLVGSSKMQQAHNWLVTQYNGWGISARNEKWGEWKGWERGITHIDMVAPWLKTLEGTQMAWSPSTGGKTVTAEVMGVPEFSDSAAFQQWLPTVKGKFVMIDVPQITGRPDDNWKQHGTPESFQRMQNERKEQLMGFTKNFRVVGMVMINDMAKAIEKAGAVGIISSSWSKGFGVNKIQQAYTKKIPAIDLSLEDYGLLHRLWASGRTPRISLRADSRETGMQPAYNTLAELKGTEKPDEMVMLSAHLDSWDAATGATDNGTGTLVMMEAMRILKKVYPNPKRSIVVGHWGCEELGLNGSRSFVEDHPEWLENIQALFNQDNGTGRIGSLSGSGFLHSYEYLTRWLSAVPEKFKEGLKTEFPGVPAGASDHASFVAAGVPAFNLRSIDFSYTDYTWHTNRDTYDKIVWDDLQSNVIMTAILAYMACEDPNRASREKAVVPTDAIGRPGAWPTPRKANRNGGLN